MTTETARVELFEEVHAVLNAESNLVALVYGWQNAQAICKALGTRHVYGKLSDMVVHIDLTGNCLSLNDLEAAIERDDARREPPPSNLWHFNGNVWQRRNKKKKLLYIVTRDCWNKSKWHVLEPAPLIGFGDDPEGTPRFDSPLLAMHAVEAFIGKTGPDPTIAAVVTGS